MHRALAWTLLFLAAGSMTAALSRSVWDGVYTKEQSSRGQARYREECAKCHAENLMGGEAAPALVGRDFLQKWTGKTVGDLFESMRKTMPSDDPGSLSRREYADIVAYLLGSNEFPAGPKELASEIAALVAEEGFWNLKAPIQRVTTPPVHVPFSPALEPQMYPTRDKIVQAVRRTLD